MQASILGLARSPIVTLWSISVTRWTSLTVGALIITVMMKVPIEAKKK
jgi:hypothetical protein